MGLVEGRQLLAGEEGEAETVGGTACSQVDDADAEVFEVVFVFLHLGRVS